MVAAGRAGVDRVIGHFLPGFKARTTGLAEILIGWHAALLSSIADINERHRRRDLHRGQRYPTLSHYITSAPAGRSSSGSSAPLGWVVPQGSGASPSRGGRQTYG